MDTAQIEREKELVGRHYDIDPKLFEYFLDKRMKYSSGYFKDGDESLDEAQEQKIRYLAGKLGVTAGDDVLDVGSGWGAALVYFAAHYGCLVTGLTLASNQAEYTMRAAADAGVAHRVKVLVRHFQEADYPPESFDKIMFIGSIIHIADRAGAADRCRRLLRPGGKLLISETYYPNRIPDGKKGNRAETFIREGIFGYGNLLTMGEEMRIMEDAGFEILHVENITPHYIKTLEKWIENVKRNQEQINLIIPGEAKRLRTYLTLARKVFVQKASHQFHILARLPG